jgi:hypothetical protein
MKNFDVFVGIDWSGAEKPVYTPTISVAMKEVASEGVKLLSSHNGQKYWSRQSVGDWIKSIMRGQDKSLAQKRILIGIDANFGYAKDILQKQFRGDPIAFDLWREVERISADSPNYYAAAFAHAWPEYFWSAGTKPDGFAMPKRLTEQACGEAGLGWPESPFKLTGAKQVGKGGLAVMRLAYDLKGFGGDDVCIWPFESDKADQAQIVIAEIYPRQFLLRAGHGYKKIQAAQTQEMDRGLAFFGCRLDQGGKVFSDHDADAVISAAGLSWLFDHGKTKVCGRITQNVIDYLNRRKSMPEGWIFGVAP